MQGILIGFFTGGEKRLKGQDVRVIGGIAFGRDLEGKDRRTRYTNRDRSQYNRPTFCFICCRSTTIWGGQSFSFGRGIASPFVPPLPLAGYGPVVWYSGRMSVFPCPALDLQLMGDVMWINCPL